MNPRTDPNIYSKQCISWMDCINKGKEEERRGLFSPATSMNSFSHLRRSA